MESNEITRNQPDDKPRNDDQETRENTGQAPGKSANSHRQRDEPSEKLTENRKGAFNEEHPDLRKDKIVDEGEE